MVKNKVLRIALIVLCVGVIVGASVFSLFACSSSSDAYADSGDFSAFVYPNMVDLGYTGLIGYPFLYEVSTPSITRNSTLSESGSFVMANIDNSLLNNTLQYSVSSANSFSFQVDNNAFTIQPLSSGSVDLTFVCDFGTGYSIPFTGFYYGFSCLWSLIPGVGINTTVLPCTVSLRSSRGTVSYNGVLDSSNNAIYDIVSLYTDDVLYSLSVSINLPFVSGKYYSIGAFRFFVSYEVSGSPQYPYHYATSVLPTNLSTDAFRDGQAKGLSEGWSTGFGEGRKLGYGEGYQKGLETASNGGWYDLFSGIFNAPLEAMFGQIDPSTGIVTGGLFNLTIPLGNTTLNMRHFFIGILSCLLVVIVIRIVIKFI